MNNKKMIIVIVSISLFFVSLLLAIQVKIINNNSFFSGMSNKERQAYFNNEYKKLLNQNESLKKANKNYKAELKQINDNMSNDTELKYLKTEIEKYKKYSGFTDVKGPGIIIKFDFDNVKNSALKGEFYSELVLLVNELNSAGAEAISINDDRIVANTEIRLAGDYIVINSKKQSPPFLVKAIGDMDTLNNSLESRFGFVDIIRERGYFIEIKKDKEISISKYEGVPEYRFIEDVDEK